LLLLLQGIAASSSSLANTTMLGLDDRAAFMMSFWTRQAEQDTRRHPLESFILTHQSFP
jgi:hypothetical protein